MTKQCRVCLETKPLEEFYRTAKSREHIGDGHDNRCKKCVKDYARTAEVRTRLYAARNKRGKSDKEKEANKQWAKKYYQTEHGKQKQRERSRKSYTANREKRLAEQSIYRKTIAFRKSIETFRQNYPKKRGAHIKVANAIAAGHLVRPPSCSVCGTETKVQAHHFDYSQPLSVIWVCKNCHSAYHRL